MFLLMPEMKGGALEELDVIFEPRTPDFNFKLSLCATRHEIIFDKLGGTGLAIGMDDVTAIRSSTRTTDCLGYESNCQKGC